MRSNAFNISVITCQASLGTIENNYSLQISDFPFTVLNGNSYSNTTNIGYCDLEYKLFF
jgi:hypothetical protein